MSYPSKHHHAGNMIFEDKICYCHECGQTWQLVLTYGPSGSLDGRKSGWVATGGGRF